VRGRSYFRGVKRPPQDFCKSGVSDVVKLSLLGRVVALKLSVIHDQLVRVRTLVAVSAHGGGYDTPTQYSPGMRRFCGVAVFFRLVDKPLRIRLAGVNVPGHRIKTDVKVSRWWASSGLSAIRTLHSSRFKEHLVPRH
jgi:hypothetical protein